MSISLKVARCLAKVPGVPWGKVEQQLWLCCPQASGAGALVLSSRHQEQTGTRDELTDITPALSSHRDTSQGTERFFLAFLYVSMA